MLDILRRNAGSWAIKFILSFIALTFIWWGVGTYSESERETAATVGGEKISMSELAEAYAGLERTYREVYGNAFSPEMAKTLNLRQQALDTLIHRTLMLAEARKMGLSATNDEVQREIAGTPAFQVDGQFRGDRYRSILSYNRVSPMQYEASKRQEITIRKIEGLLAAAGRVPESEARDLFHLTYRKVRLLVAISDPRAVRGVPPPTEGEIAARYDQDKESYRIPARVKISVARFSPETLAEKTVPSEQEIQSFYEGNSDRFRTEESRLVDPVLLPYTSGNKEAVRRKAEELLAEANKGKAAFEAIGKKHSRRKTGASWLTRREMRPELADAVFSAPVDGVVGPVDTGEGFVLARVNQIRFPENLPLSQVRERVVAMLKYEKGKDLAVIRAYESHGKAIESGNLKEACAPHGVIPVETGWTSDGKGADVPPAVVQEALLHRPGEIGPVKSIGETHYLFQVTAKEDSRLPPLSDVREKVAATVDREKRSAAARAALETALAGAKTASDLESASRKSRLEVTTTPLFAPLSDSLPGIISSGGDIRRELLRLSPKSPVSPEVFSAGARYFALAIVEERQADPKEWGARKESFLQEVEAQKKRSVVEAFLADRRNQAKVEINPQALK